MAIQRLAVLALLLCAAIPAHAVKNVDIFTKNVPNGQNGAAYTATVKGKYGTKPYTWSIGSGALPTGFNPIDSATGAITGTSVVNGTYNFVVHVVDSAGSPTSDNQSLHITISGSAPAPTPAVSITTTGLPTGIVGGAYNTTLQASGGTAPYTWSIPADCIAPNCALPPAASLTGATGVIAGTLTDAGTYSARVRVTDSSPTPQTADRAFAVSIAAAPSPAPLFEDDFESGNFAAWTTIVCASGVNCPAVNTNRVHAGTYSYEQRYVICSDPTNPTCGASHQDINRYPRKTLSPAPTTLFVRGWLYLKTPEPGGTKDGVQRKVYGFQAANGEWFSFVTMDAVAGVNRIRLTQNGSSACGVTAASFQFGEATLWDGWHSLEVKVQLNTPGLSDGQTALWIDGVQLGSSSTNRNIRGTCTTGIDHVRVGLQADRNNYDPVDEYRYWDDIVFSLTGPIGP